MVPALPDLLLSAISQLPSDMHDDTVVFGSAAALLRGAISRPPQDLDLFVSEATLHRLGFETNAAGVRVHKLAEHVDVFATFPGVEHTGVRERSEVTVASRGLRVGASIDLAWWKLAQTRPVTNAKGIAKRETDIADLVSITRMTDAALRVETDPPTLAKWVATCPRAACSQRMFFAAPLNSGHVFLKLVGAAVDVRPHPMFGNMECIAANPCTCGHSGLFVYRKNW